MNCLNSRSLRFLPLIAAGAFAAATIGQPTRAHAQFNNYGGAVAAGIIGGAVLGIIASQAAKANQSPSEHRPQVKRAKKVTAPASVKPEAQAQVARQTPPPMNSDPFKGVVPAAVPASNVSPTSF